MTVYDPTFYETIRAGCQASAAVVAPLVHKLLKPETVVDVGCGEGWWAKAFEDLGCEVFGLDGDWPGAGAALVNFQATNLEEVVVHTGEHRDLVISLEVAEHLSPGRAVSFIEELVAYTPKAILFSAAIPGQAGVGHVNCQWQSYWAALIKSHGYLVTGGLRRELWNDERVEPWYRQNMLLAVRSDMELKGALYHIFEKPWPLDLVHPTIWGWYRS